MAMVNKVLYNVDQRADTTAEEKQTARQNIGAVSSTDLITEISRAQNAEASARSEVVGGTGIGVSKTTGAAGQDIYTVSNTKQSTLVTTTSTVLDVTSSTPAEHIDINLDNQRISTDSDNIGYVAPYLANPLTTKVLTLPANSNKPVWGEPTGEGRLLRHNAELYLYDAMGDGEAYHVRNVANNCLNHVAVTNLQNRICSLLIEAPTLAADEEYNYTVVFDCVNSSGGCNVTVENAAARLVTTYGVTNSSEWLRITGADSASDAISPEIKVTETVTPNSHYIKDGDGNQTSVVYSVGKTEKYLRIDSASYYGIPTTVSGPKVVTDVTGTSQVITDTAVNFAGSPVCQVRVHGGCFEVVRY